MVELNGLSKVTTRVFMVVAVLALGANSAWAYEYDDEDPTQGAGSEASWRATAKWDVVDEVATKEIHVHTTDAKYLTPMVSYVPEHASVPSPRDVLGYISGTEGKLTHPDDTKRYFQALADASPRVLLQSMGLTEEGRDMLLVIVSSEENLGRLEELKAYTRRLSDPRGVSEAEALDISAKAKPFMHITAGLHSPETGPPEMVMELAYRIAVSNHPDIQEIRENVVFLITPVTDVDGRARVIEWNERYLEQYDDRRYMPSLSPPYWGKYSFHDNNRDGIQLTQKLTQNYLAMFNEWHTTYSLDLHESVPLLYVAGGTGPYNPTLDPIVIREWQMLAHWELAELQKHNLPGVWTWGFYTGWNPGYLLWITNNRNSMGRFYETFGNSVSRTMERELTGRKFAGKEVTDKTWYRADPPDKKVMWSMRNNTNYMQSGVLASLTFTARNGSTLLHNYWKKGLNSIERGKNEAPHAWVIPADQPVLGQLAHLINQLLRHGIEVHRATADFEIDDHEYSSGDFIVRLDQPYGSHARNLLETQKFPPKAQYPAYDDVSWTLGLFYGVETIQIDDEEILEVDDIELVEEPVRFPGSVADEATTYAIKHQGNRELITARYMLEGFKVFAAEEAFEAGGESFPIGSWIVPGRRGLNAKLAEVADTCMLDVYALDEEPEVAKHELDLPRIALYHNWISTQNDGWVRYTLDNTGIPYAYINDDDIKRGGLRGKYDVIMLAHQGGSGKSLTHGRDAKFGAMPYTTTKGQPSHGVIDSSDDITGGFGFKGLANLEDFLDGGGTLLLMGGAGRLATDMGLLRNVSASSGGGVSTRGSTIQTKVLRRDHPIAYGYDDIDYVFRVESPLFSVPKKYDHWIVLQYGTKDLRDEDDEDDEEDENGEGDKDSAEDEADEDADEDEDEDANDKPKRKSSKNKKKFLLSGFVSGKSSLEAKGAIIDVPRNAGGRVILYSFNPLHRHLNHHDHNYVFNALLNWNDFPTPEPKDHPKLVAD